MESNPEAVGAMAGTVMLVFVVGIWVFVSLTLVGIANKLGHTDHAWWGWVPIMNTFLIIEMAGKPMHWLLFMFIPIVNLVVFAILGMEIARRRGYSPFVGLLCLVPFVQFITMGMLAWGAGSTPNRFPAGSQPSPVAPNPQRTQVPQQPMGPSQPMG